MQNIKLYNKEWCDTATQEQIETLLNDPCLKDAEIAIMPDAHKGVYVNIGFSALLKQDSINPDIVSNDIGCGVTIVKFPKGFKPSRAGTDKRGNRKLGTYELIDEAIRGNQIDQQARFGFGKVTRDNFETDYLMVNSIQEEIKKRIIYTFGDFKSKRIDEEKLDKELERCLNTFATLGNGNHFVEVLYDQDKNYYLAVHSGSRAIGGLINHYFIDYSKSSYEYFKGLEWKRIMDETPDDQKQTAIDKFKADYPVFIPSYNLEDYYELQNLGVNWAEQSRLTMLRAIWAHLGFSASTMEYSLITNTKHNFLEKRKEVFIVRKGAVPAYQDDILAIPLNMAEGILLCRGKGNETWNYTAPHGAGRKFSRAQAKKEYSLELFQDTMKNAHVYSTTINQFTLDETPQAYKDSEMIKKELEPTAEIVSVLKTVYNFKCY